jgi:23S rRNA (guanosine2251-2'-O)-methyltransferase
MTMKTPTPKTRTPPPPRGERAASGGADRRSPRMLYGVNPVREALAAGRRILDAHVLSRSQGPDLKRIVAALRERGVPILPADRHDLSTLSGTTRHQGVVARVESLPNGSLTGLVKDRPDEPLTVLLLDHLQDPQNLGAVYRAAEAFGVHLVFLPAHASVSHQLGSVAKASAGAVEHVPTVVVRDLKTPIAELRGHGFAILGLEPERGEELCCSSWPERTAIVLGSEGGGLAGSTRALCDRMVSIPTAGHVASLNAASACAIVLYERRRDLLGRPAAAASPATDER